MATISKGNVLQKYVEFSTTVTITPGSGGSVRFDCSSPVGVTRPSPRTIYSATEIVIPGGSTFTAEAFGADATYTDDGEVASLQALVPEYGNVSPPSSLTLPSALAGLTAYGRFAGSPGDWRSSISPEDLIDSDLYTITYYVDADGGNDSNSGLTWALRKQSIRSAYDAAQASGATGARIMVRGNTTTPYYRGLSFCPSTTKLTGAVPIIFEAVDGRVDVGPFLVHTWTKTGNYYSAAIASAGRCFNMRLKGAFGLPLEYKWVASSAAVDAERGTWYADGTNVYVRTHDDSPADIFTARICLTTNNVFGLEWNTAAALFIRGFDVFSGYGGAAHLAGAGSAGSGIVIDDCTFRAPCRGRIFSGATTVIDAVLIEDAGPYVAVFKSDASLSQKDGWNAATSTGTVPLLVNCTGYANGSSVSLSNQGYTLHSGMHGVSIGCTFLGNYGGGIGHASNGTRGWHCGDLAGMTSGDAIAGGTDRPGYGFGAATGASVLHLDYCRDVGAEYGLYNYDTGQIIARGHRGIGRRSASGITYL